MMKFFLFFFNFLFLSDMAFAAKTQIYIPKMKFFSLEKSYWSSDELRSSASILLRIAKDPERMDFYVRNLEDSPEAFLTHTLVDLQKNSQVLSEFAGAASLDFRPLAAGLLDLSFVGYLMAIKEIVNKNNKKQTVVYGGCGADISSILLATNATKIICIDKTQISASVFEDRLKNFAPFGSSFQSRDEQKMKDNGILKDYFHYKQVTGAGISKKTEGMVDLELKIIAEFLAMGVSKKNIIVSARAQSIHVKFDWAYLNDTPKARELIFFQTDLTKPAEYPSELKKILAEGIDGFFQKAGAKTGLDYKDYIPTFSSATREDGFLISSDYVTTGNSMSVTSTKTEAATSFASDFCQLKNEEVSTAKMKIFEFFKSLLKARMSRRDGSIPSHTEYEYWWRLTVAKKSLICQS